MGAGYGAGAYFFLRVYRSTRWHEVAVGVISAAAFALLMLITTIIHFDKFNQGDAPALAAIAFYGWTIVYVLSPWVVAWLWWANERQDPRAPDAGDRVVPPTVRLMARAAGAAALLDRRARPAVPGHRDRQLGLVAHAADRPRARLLHGAGRVRLPAAVARPALERLARAMQTFLIAVGLLLIGAARAWDAFDHDKCMSWAYVIGLAGGAGRAAGAVSLDGARRAPRRCRPAPVDASGAWAIQDSNLGPLPYQRSALTD